jgi:uncharacterized RDD family membrane protein YckC
MSDANDPGSGPQQPPRQPPPPPPPPSQEWGQQDQQQYGQPGGQQWGPPPGDQQHYGQPGPQQDGQPPGGGYGGIGKRLVARILDGLIVAIPLSILFAILPGLRPGGMVYSVVAGVAGFAYFVVLETSSGATFGKQILGMRVTDAAGATITTDASFRRNWWMLLSAAGGIPIIGWLASLAGLVIVIVIAVTISSDPRNQGFHDKMADTLVVERT